MDATKGTELMKEVAFRVLDHDNERGLLDAETMMQAVGDYTKAQNLIVKADKDGDGLLNLTEFKGIWSDSETMDTLHV